MILTDTIRRQLSDTMKEVRAQFPEARNFAVIVGTDPQDIGDKRERTWLVLAVHILPTRWCEQMGITAQRTRLWAARWWHLEPDMRMALYRSAERAGGQLVHPFYRFPTKRKPTFEQLMGRGRG